MAMMRQVLFFVSGASFGIICHRSPKYQAYDNRKLRERKAHCTLYKAPAKRTYTAATVRRSTTQNRIATAQRHQGMQPPVRHSLTGSFLTGERESRPQLATLACHPAKSEGS